MKALNFTPLVIAFAVACGSGDIAGSPGTGVDDSRPLIYSEQPYEAAEKPAAALEDPALNEWQPNQVQEPTAAELGSQPSVPNASGTGGTSGGNTGGTSSGDTGGTSSGDTGGTSSGDSCSYYDDACLGCSSYQTCVTCYSEVEPSIAETVCGVYFG